MESNDRKAAVLRAAARMGIGVVLFRNTMAKATGVSLTESLCLTLLGLLPGLSPSELARLIGLSTGSMSNLLDRLEARDFVVRHAHDSDRRRVTVALGEAYRRESAALVQPVQLSHRDLISRYSPEQLELIEGFLAAFTDNLRASSADVREVLDRGSRPPLAPVAPSPSPS